MKRDTLSLSLSPDHVHPVWASSYVRKVRGWLRGKVVHHLPATHRHRAEVLLCVHVMIISVRAMFLVTALVSHTVCVCVCVFFLSGTSCLGGCFGGSGSSTLSVDAVVASLVDVLGGCYWRACFRACFWHCCHNFLSVDVSPVMIYMYGRAMIDFFVVIFWRPSMHACLLAPKCLLGVVLLVGYSEGRSIVSCPLCSMVCFGEDIYLWLC